MLAERGDVARPRPLPTDEERRADDAQQARLRARLGDELVVRELRVREYVPKVVDGAARDAGRLEALDPLGGGAGCKGPLELGLRGRELG